MLRSRLVAIAPIEPPPVLFSPSDGTLINSTYFRWTPSISYDFEILGRLPHYILCHVEVTREKLRSNIVNKDYTGIL